MKIITWIYIFKEYLRAGSWKLSTSFLPSQIEYEGSSGPCLGPRILKA